MDQGFLWLRVHAVRTLTPTVKLFDLRAPAGETLPAAAPGAHIDLLLGPDLVRSYSLVNGPDDADRYLIAVLREEDSRGGSALLHDEIRVGELIEAAAPRNHFALAEDDGSPSVLIAGGIGVTPIWAMAQALAAAGRPWRLHYAARSAAEAAFADEILALASAGQARLHFSREAGSGRPDLAAIVGEAPAGAHFYACGPAGLLDAFRDATAHVPPERVHLEQFHNATAPAAEGGFAVELARSGLTVPIEPGQTILEALKAAGIRADYSCREGVCGTCETRVLAGAPDHRDAVLTDAEKAGGEVMMICCSGSLTDRLVLDL